MRFNVLTSKHFIYGVVLCLPKVESILHINTLYQCIYINDSPQLLKSYMYVFITVFFVKNP